jgi:hypothetical protein
MVIRTWAEYLTPGDATKKSVIRLLKKYDVNLGMAFPAGSMNKDFARMFAEYEQAGVATSVWALLPDNAGYWANEGNAKEYTEYVYSIYDWADRNKFGIPWLAVDLETPHSQAIALKEARGLDLLRCARDFYKANRNPGRFYDAGTVYAKLAGAMRARGVKTVTAASNFVADDFKMSTIGFQDLLETPISTVGWDVISFMIYTSMFAGYFGSIFSRAGACRYLYSTMSDMKEALWSRAAVSIGCTYIGKLGDEPYYKTPKELLPDMQAAKAALVDDIAIYNLEGILRSPKPEEWFETLLSCEARVPAPDFRADTFKHITNIASRLI